MAAWDICVIGAGSGGLTVAAIAAKFGQRVVLIEKGAMGGDCLNSGCVPSKALLAAARQAHLVRNGEKFGIAAGPPSVDFARVRAHVKSVIAAIAPQDSQERFEALGVKVIRDTARFTGPDRVEAGGETITARRFVVATGSRPAIPAIAGIDSVPFFTNETIFDIGDLPAHLIIIGGGPMGMEMAQAHRRLGARVTVVEADVPLSREDAELSGVVLDQFAAEDITVMAGTRIAAVRREANGVALDVESGGRRQTLAGSHLLVAAGRQPNIENLGLEAAGVATNAQGIAVDAGLRSTNRRVYAVGDVAGGPQFTHLAGYQAVMVVKNILLRLPVRRGMLHIPRVTFTDPELAQVGLREAEARAAHGDGAVSVLRWTFEENDRAQTERRTAGLIKVVIGKGGRILGAGIAGAQAGELIGTWALAISSGLKIRHMAKAVMPYPTFGEINKRAAICYYTGHATKPWLRSVISLMARFG